MKLKSPKFENQSHTIVLFTILLLSIVFTFEIKAQSYQFLIGNPAVTDTNTNYTLNAGLTRYYFDSLHAIDTSIHSFLPGEKAFKRYKYVMQDRIYSSGEQIGGDIFASAEMGKKLLLQNIQPCANSDYPWTMVGPRNTGVSTLGIVMAVAIHPSNPDIIYAGTQASGLWRTENGTQAPNNVVWENVTDELNLPALGISWIEFDPSNSNTVYFATGAHGHSGMLSYGAGIFRITNNGIPTNIIDFSNQVYEAKDFFVSKFVFHPDNSNIMYAISTKNFYKLVKNGLGNWSIAYSKDALDPVFPLFIGKAWSYSNYLEDLEVQKINNVLQIYISTHRHKNAKEALVFARAWRNDENLNTNWQEIFTNLPDYQDNRYISLEVSNNDPGVLYCMVNRTLPNGDNDNNVQLYKSTNNGLSFNFIKGVDVGYVNSNPSGNHLFIVSDIDKNIAFIGENVLYKSTNFQSTADFSNPVSDYYPSLDKNSTLGRSHADIRGIGEFHSNGQAGIHKLVIGHDGGISMANLGTGTGWANLINTSNWTNINGNLELSQAFGFDIYPETGYPVIGLQDNGTQKFIGQEWLQKGWGDGAAVEISKSSTSYIYLQSNNAFYKYDFSCFENSNSTFGCLNYISIPIKQFQNMPMKLDPVDDRTLWAAQNKLYKYNPLTYQTTPLPANSNYLSGDNNITNDDIRTFDISKSNPNIIMVGNTDPTWGGSYTKRLYKSDNGGISFFDITQNVLIKNEQVFDYYSITSVLINPNNSNTIYLALNGFKEDLTNPNQGKFRVIKSTDGGLTWNDMSTGLSQFPVTCLVFQEGTEEVLYAGTDLGVYRWNKQLQKWECYSNGLPKVIITNLEIDYCRNKLLCSTWGRGIWKADLKPVEDVFEITQSQTWNNVSYHGFNTNVSVKSGVTLTIKGSVTFAKDNWLQIEPGAKVIVDGGKLFNNCNENWEGIHIAGDPNKTQYPNTNQGYLYIKDAEIINADVAISTAALYPNGTINWSKTGGGIVVAVNTRFKNNKRHVEFMEYKRTNNYAGSFTNCTFELNQTCPNNVTTCMNNMTMVTAWGVHGIKFIGCEFNNNNGASNANLPNYNRGTGIFTLDATLLVSATLNPTTCIPQDRGHFRNLTHGIESAHSPSFVLSGITNIKHQDFELNDKGIVVENGVSYNIYKNNFNLNVPSNYYNRFASSTDLELGITGISGIYSNSASGFLFEQNYFTYPNANHTTNEIVAGLVLQNSDGNGGGGSVRLNQISDAYLGCQTQQNNLALQISCNQFLDNANAINLNPVSNSINYATPFFGFCDPNNQDIRTDYFNTFYTNLTYDAVNHKIAPKTYVVKPGEIDRPDQSKSLNVNLNYCLGIGTVGVKDNCSLTASIQDNCTGTIENPNPNIGNYFSLKTLKLYWQNEVENAGLSGESLDQAKRNLRFYKIESTQARNHVIWAYNMRAVFDSTFNNIDSIIAFLQNETDIDSRKQLIAAYYAKGDYNLATQSLSALETNTDELTDFATYYNLLINAFINSRNIYSLNSEEIAVLETLAEDGITSPSLSARAILSLTQGKWYDLVIERVVGEELLTKRKQLNELDSNNTVTLSAQILKIFPNPADNSFHVSLNTVLENNKILLKDAIGKTILEQKMPNNRAELDINTMSLSNGVYFVLIINQNAVLEVKKIVINH